MLKKYGAVRLSINGTQLKEMAKNSIGVNSITAQFIVTQLIDEIFEQMAQIKEIEAKLESITYLPYSLLPWHIFAYPLLPVKHLLCLQLSTIPYHARTNSLINY